jgi:hypothetical protein
VPFSEKEAFKWYTLAANRGHGEALHTIGSMYARGVGCKQDADKAVECFKNALQHGYASADMIRVLEAVRANSF